MESCQRLTEGATNIQFAKRRLLVINWHDISHPQAGGAEVYLHEIFKRLVSRGHSVTLLCCQHPGGAASEDEVIDGIQILRHGSRPIFNFLVPSFYRQICHRQKFDLIIEDMNKLPVFSPTYAKSRVLVMTMHLFGRTIFQQTAWPFASYVYWLERAIPLVYSRCQFLAISPSTKANLVNYGICPNRIQVIYPGVSDIYTFKPGYNAPFPLIVYVGRLKKYKNVETLLFAVKEVAQQVPQVKLFIVGTGDDLPRLLKICSRLNLGGTVEFKGYVSTAEKVKYYQQAWICVQPSLVEGWGLTTLEANACGTPVIASDAPGLRDSVINAVTGLLFESKNKKMLAQKILWTLQNGSVRTQMSESALNWANQFNWEKTSLQTETLIDGMIHPGSRKM